jgi:hypothetical protein
MWAPILEKAWAKMKGSYTNADGGLITNGLRSLTGAPVFKYSSSINNSDDDIKTLF